MHVIGTAGHIDHGKSTLIHALTGSDPDRLKEEKERGMTIDLGFAWISLPSGREAGIVDVPGHHRFVPNMLAGVGGVDMVLFVVAATESWMPQSQEHLSIIDLLGIRRGLVVLTKIDLVDPDWLEMVGEEVKGKLASTCLANVEIVPVSSTTGQGLDYLRERIDATLAGAPAASDLGRPRLWVDRVFTIRGTGTVVTGTLDGGTLELDQQVSILPGGALSRVRGLQTHKRSIEKATPGTRVAVNLAGIETDTLGRGDALTGIAQRFPTDTINVSLRLIENLDFALPERSKLKLYVGSAELLADVRLLDRTEMVSGETGLAQIRLERGAAIDFDDRFILRDAARQQTVGGGRVLDARAERVRGRDLRMPRSALGAYRVLATERTPVRRLSLELLAARAGATPQALILVILQERGWAGLGELAREVPLAPQRLRMVLADSAGDGKLVLLPSYALSLDAWQALGQRLETELTSYHSRFPLRLGLGRETLRGHLRMEAKLFEECVARFIEQGCLVSRGAILKLPYFHPSLTPAQEQEVARILRLMNSRRFSPPGLDQLIGEMGFDSEVVNALVEQGRLVKIGRGLVCLDEALVEVKAKVAAAIRAQGGIEVGEIRDMLGTTRKYSVPLLEYLDQIGFTRRVGDKRVLA